MKDIIKQVLNENIDPKDHIKRIDWIDAKEIRLWQEEGLTPYIFTDNGNDKVEFRPLTIADLSPEKKSKLSGKGAFLLTDIQAKYALKFADPIIKKIILTRRSVETEKQLFLGVLVHKFMKNAFGKMTIDEPNDEATEKDIAPQDVIDTIYGKIANAIATGADYQSWLNRIKSINGRIPNKIQNLINSEPTA
jgi:hypothetical protein